VVSTTSLLRYKVTKKIRDHQTFPWIFWEKVVSLHANNKKKKDYGNAIRAIPTLYGETAKLFDSVTPCPSHRACHRVTREVQNDPNRVPQSGEREGERITEGRETVANILGTGFPSSVYLPLFRVK